MKINKYTAEQKAEVLELLADKFTSQAISEVLEIPSGTIRRWKLEAGPLSQLEQPEAPGLELLNQRVDAQEVALREEIDNLKNLVQRLLGDLKNTVDRHDKYIDRLQLQETKHREQSEYESGQTRQVSSIFNKKAVV